MRLERHPIHTHLLVSDQGNVYSTKLYAGSRFRELTYQDIRGGYIDCKVGGQYKLVHRLVLETFAGLPAPGLQANHKNGNKRDNRLENLEWTTQQENLQHAMEGGLHAKPPRPIIGTNKKTGEKVTFASQQEAGKNGFTQSNIHNCLAGTQRYAKGYSWEYAE